MPVPTSPTTAVAGQPTKASLQFNALAAQVAYLLTGLPIAVILQTTTQSIANAPSPFAAVTFPNVGDEAIDRDNMHDPTTNPTRFLCVTAGWYQVDYAVAYAANGTGRRLCELALNGNATGIAATQRGGSAAASGSSYISGSWKIQMTVGQYFELRTYQDSGGALSTLVSGSGASGVAVSWLCS